MTLDTHTCIGLDGVVTVLCFSQRTFDVLTAQLAMIANLAHCRVRLLFWDATA